MIAASLVLISACSPPKSGDSGAPPPLDTQAPADSGGDSGGLAPRPDILVISIDTLRVKQLGRYSGLDTTPFIDGLLEQGLVLDRHRSCSNWTYPSFVCALGAGDLSEVGFIPTQGSGGFTDVPAEVTLLYERLAARGYWTGLVSSNTFLSENMSITQGVRSEELINEAPAEEVIALGLEVLDAQRAAEPDRPWALHLHFFDVHWPYAAPEGYTDEVDALEPIGWNLGDTGQLRQLGEAWPTIDAATQELILQHLDATYRGELRYLDDQLRGLFEALEARGALDDVAVMIFSDHGEQFFEHGELGHRLALYEEENRALAGFWGPSIAPGTWTGGTAHGDLLPTFFDLLGWREDGLYGLAAGQGAADRPLFTMDWADSRSRLGLVSGDRKLLYRWSGEREYYELDSDPEELSDRLESADWADLDELLMSYARAVQSRYFPDASPPG